MDEGDLQAFVDRARETLDRSPGMSARTTELRVVLPLLTALGWGIHGHQVRPEYAVDVDDDGDGPVEVDYALLVDGDPAAFVVTGAAGEDVDEAAVRRLGTAMTAAGVDLGLATNGRTYVLLGRRGDRVERARLDLADLAEDPAPLAHYTRAATERRRRHYRRERRREAAGDLSDDRDALVGAVTDALADGTGTDLDGELATAGEAFVDRVLDALAAGNHPETAVAGRAGGDDAGTAPARDADTAGGSGDGGSNAGRGTVDRRAGPTPTGRDGGDEPGPAEEGREEHATPEEGSPDGPGEDPGEAGDGSGEESSDATGEKGSDDDSEYVVRFFNDRNSVGAVGHGTATGATAQAVEFLIEQFGLDSRLQLPWGPDDADGRAIVTREPVHPDGTEMSDATQLSNGYYLYADLPAAANRRVIETLAGKAGLRVMFQGDWTDPDG